MSKSVFTRIKAPTFKVNGQELNEYELRQLMLDIVKGEKEPGYTIVDQKGGSFVINKEGQFESNKDSGTYGSIPYGMDIADDIHMKHLLYRNVSVSNKKKAKETLNKVISTGSSKNKLQECFIRTYVSLLVK